MNIVIRAKEGAATFDIDVKRFYMPFEIAAQCPNCNAVCEVDLGREYLSYPTVGARSEVFMYCGACDDGGRDAEFSVYVVLGFTLQVADSQKDEES